MYISDIASENGLFQDGDWVESKDQDINGTVRLIQLADIGEGVFLNKSNRYLTESKAAELNCTFLQQGDILIARLGNPLCRACIFPFSGRFITAVDIAILRIGIKTISAKFLVYLLNSPWFKAQIKQYESGTTRKRISRKNLDRVQLYIPPLQEQERIIVWIGELFSQLDAGVETLKKTKAQLAVYRQAVLKEAFSSCKEKKPIREVSSLVTSGSRGWAAYYSQIGARFIRITDLTRTGISLNNKITQRVLLPEKAEGKRSRLQDGDVLVSITADLGSIALIPDNFEEAYINQHIAMIRFNNSKQGEFMAWYLRSEWGQNDLLKNKRGGGKLGLGLDDIRDTPVPVVSNEGASEIVAFIDSRLSICYSIEQTVEAALQQAEALRHSVLKQAFDGQL